MTMELLLFRIGSELFGAELSAVEEAIDLADVQQVPGATAPVRGVFTLRGTLVPLLSPAAALGVTPGDAATALVVRDGAGRIAIAADDVEDVLSVLDGELRPLPAANSRAAGVIRGIVRHGADLVAVVDLAALIAACRGTPQPETT
jgi:purine-binding chemotaxis protein CheW